MPLPKKLLFYALLTVLTLAALEGMARLAYFLAFDQWYRANRTATPAADSSPDFARQPYWWRIQHPLHGYTDPAPKDDLNRQPPRPGTGDVVLIALAGGSVAESLFPFLDQALSRHFAANNLTRRPVLLRLAMQGMKQPQQTIAAAHLLAAGGHFDILVNLDGHNEIANTRINLNSAVFPFFPIHWDKDADLTAAETLLVGQIGILRRQQAELTRAAGSRLRYTAVFALLQRHRLQRTADRITQLNHALAATQTAYGLERRGPRYPFRWQSPELTRQETQAWYRASLLLSELAQLAGAEYYHFLQPSQYVPNSKSLTAAELACCYQADGADAAEHRAAYPQLLALGAQLQRQGVNYRDLNGIFADNYETLYMDKCCHFNERGRELLAAAIVQQLAPALRRAAAAPPPLSPLTPAAPSQTNELLINADFQVYRAAGRRLLYSKADCSPADTADRFFLHITPADPADLPPDRRQYGFDNRDFRFADAGTVFNGKCIVELPLPHYPITSLRTGQYIYGGAELWAGEYRFPK